MKKVKIRDLRDKFCYEPGRFGYFRDPKWEGTALDVLRATEPGVSEDDFIADRMFVVLRPEFIEERVLVRYMVWCIRTIAGEGEVPAQIEPALEAAQGFAEKRVSEKVFRKAWKVSGYEEWEASFVFMMAREARRAAPWPKQRDKLIEMLQADEKR